MISLVVLGTKSYVSSSDEHKSTTSFLSFIKRSACFHLGLDFVYIMNVEKNTVRVFGGSGKDGGLFSDPAGITVDNKGNMIVADSRNHKLKVETKDDYKSIS